VESKHFLKAAVLTFGLVVIFVAGWEVYWRSRGFGISYNDDKILWASKRKEVYKPARKAQTSFVLNGHICRQQMPLFIQKI
jgi:hypothetical protein